MMPRLVIRTHAPLRRLLVWGGLLIGLPVALYLAFEFGRYRAGYDVRSAATQRQALAAQIRELEGRDRERRVQMAALESSKIGQNRERSEVARTIGELQAQVARQAQDLAFYRGIVGDTAQAPVTIQQFRVVVGVLAQHYTLKLVLGRPVRPEDIIGGALGITLEGLQGAAPASRELAQLTADRKREIAFNFRYLQPIDVDIDLPAGFVPERVTVELRPSRKGATPLRQTFLWTPESA